MSLKAGPRQIDIRRRDVIGKVIDYLDDEYAYNLAGLRAGFRLHIQTFDKAIPMFLANSQEMERLFFLDGRQYFNPSAGLGCDMLPNLLDNPLRISMMVNNEDRPDDPRALAFSKFRSLSREEARAVARPWSPYVIEMTTFFPDGDRPVAGRIYLAWREGMFKPCAVAGGGDLRIVPDAEKDIYWDKKIKMNISIQLTEETFWHVHFKKHGRPGILLPTYPHIARQMFQYRDVPKGKTRRQALLNWVEGHYRGAGQGMSDLERACLAVYVKGHFRGSSTFTWLGLECEVLPSASDLKKAEREDLLSEWRHIGALLDMPPVAALA